MLAAILTIGNELVSGDDREHECVVACAAARVARRQGRRQRRGAGRGRRGSSTSSAARAPRVDHLIVTGGLGGTPDDITRESLAIAFGAPQEIVPRLAADLRARFHGDPDYAARWAALPRGSRPLDNPLGGAPGFQIGNTWVLPGLPSEMEAMFDLYADELARRPADRRRGAAATRRASR